MKKEFIKKWSWWWRSKKRGEEITLSFEKELDELINIEKNKHMHVAGTTKGLHIDTCADCGNDLRHPIHESITETEREQQEYEAMHGTWKS